MSEAGRVYGGRSEAERRADRRARLTGAGLALFGSEGYAVVTIERLCAVAGVATRSFYEEFSGREALLRHVYDQLVADATTAVVAAVAAVPDDLTARVRAGVAAYVDHMTDDPRRARVAHREARNAGVLTDDREQVVAGFAALIGAEIAHHRPDLDADACRLLAVALAGAVNEVLVDWVATPPPRPSTGPLVDGLVRLVVAALTAPAHDGGGCVALEHE